MLLLLGREAGNHLGRDASCSPVTSHLGQTTGAAIIPLQTPVYLWAGASLGAGVLTVLGFAALSAREGLRALGDQRASSRAVSVGNTDVFLLFGSK